MKKIIFGVFILVFGMIGSASAISFTDTEDINKLLGGAGTYSWTHNTPADFSVPPDTVNSATLEIFAYGINGNNDPVYVQTNFVGNLSNVEFKWSTWTLEGTEFDISGIFTPTWDDNSFTVTLNYNEFIKFFCWPIPDCFYLDKSIFTLDYDNGQNGSAPVPEPSTMLLLGAGLLGLVGYNRRRSSKKAS